MAVCITLLVSPFLHLYSNTHHNTAHLSVDFPHWGCLHGIWHTLQNFNPYTHSAEHGQNLAAQVVEFLGGHTSTREKDGDPEKGHNEPSMSHSHSPLLCNPSPPPNPSLPSLMSPSIAPTAMPHVFTDDPRLPKPGYMGSLGWGESQSVSQGQTSSQGQLYGLALHSKGSSLFTIAEYLVTLTDGSDTLVENITSLASNRLEHVIAEQSAKCMKYETLHATVKVNADLELEKKKLKQEECILEMKHTHEWEKEMHQLRMLQLQLSI